MQDEGSSGDLSGSFFRGDRRLISVPHPVPLPDTPPAERVPSGSFLLDEPPSRPSAVFRDPEKGLQCPPFKLMPPSSTREHFRDISFLGPITLHRFFTLVWIVGSGAALFFLQHWMWPSTFSSLLRPDLSTNPVWSYIGVLWLIALPAALAAVAGNFLFYYPTKLDDVPRTAHNVVFRIVSRGTNEECLISTIRSVQRQMRLNSLFPYLIEVVTDAGVFEAPNEPDVIHLIVPMDYRAPNGTLYKARALHYACLHSVVPPDTWVVHLDEETQPTSSGIKGIAKMVAETEASGNVERIGQGAILYHRSWSEHPFLTLADMRRTGDDMGQFHLQHRLGFTMFGLHGAYIVCRQDVEAKLGFDLGVPGSITEDAWWVLLAMEKGYRTKWVDGYLDEQSTQSIMDFLKQRRRWYVGLWKVSWYCPAKLHFRLFVIFNTVTWIVIPIMIPFIAVYMTYLSYFKIPVPFFVRVLTNFIISASALVYLSGLVANMREHGTKWWQGIFWLFMMLISIPACYLMEAASVLMAFFSPFSESAKGFHVVEKSAKIEKSISSTSDDSSREGTSSGEWEEIDEENMYDSGSSVLERA